jgi:hypothetical protein
MLMVIVMTRSVAVCAVVVVGPIQTCQPIQHGDAKLHTMKASIAMRGQLCCSPVWMARITQAPSEELAAVERHGLDRIEAHRRAVSVGLTIGLPRSTRST